MYIIYGKKFEIKVLINRVPPLVENRLTMTIKWA